MLGNLLDVAGFEQVSSEQVLQEAREAAADVALDNKVSGDAMAVSLHDDAKAYADNTAKNGGSAGDDEIHAGNGSDIIAGDAQAVAGNFAYAEQIGRASGRERV